jgi:hypothetical protein
MDKISVNVIVKITDEDGTVKERYFADMEQALEFQELCLFTYGIDAEIQE